MKKQLLILSLLVNLTCLSAFGWGKVGHDAIAYIAECNLTPQAKANIEKYIDGKSIVYFASWLDKVRYTPEYKHTTKWHGYGVDVNGMYKPRPKGDAVQEIMRQTELLKDYKNLPDSTVAVGIKMLVHMIGDMHCPSHTSYEGRKQAYSFKIVGKSYGFHSFWDTYALENNHRWYYTDYEHQLDRFPPEVRDSMAAGTPIDWANENSRNCNEIYQWILADQEFDKPEACDYMMKVEELADMQVVKAGYRMARVLNDIFGN